VLLVGTLYLLWRGAETPGEGLLARVANVRGLHMAVAVASSLASYLNLLLLWRALRREAIYQREPGWGRHLLRLAVACTLMVAVILVGLAIWPEWSTASVIQRAWRLGIIIAAAGGIYVACLYVSGLRLRDLRAH